MVGRYETITPFRHPSREPAETHLIGAELGATPKHPEQPGNANGCAATIDGTAGVRIDRMVQGVHYSLGVEGERGNAPPPAPAGDPRSVAPKGKLALPPQSGDFGQSRAASPSANAARHASAPPSNRRHRPHVGHPGGAVFTLRGSRPQNVRPPG